VTTHLHNGHTPSESDGNPCNFFEIGQFYDQHYPNVYAGINSTHPGTGDIREALHTLWYHDHRVDFTAQNTYKGLAGMYLLFNDKDTGDELTGFHLPSFPQYDIPMVFNDKVIDPSTGQIFFDLFNLDGVLGDRFLVNGKVQPVLHVSPRRYRFRWLNTGPSRFYQFFLTDLTNLGANNTFWQISTTAICSTSRISLELTRQRFGTSRCDRGLHREGGKDVLHREPADTERRARTERRAVCCGAGRPALEGRRRRSGGERQQPESGQHHGVLRFPEHNRCGAGLAHLRVPEPGRLGDQREDLRLRRHSLSGPEDSNERWTIQNEGSSWHHPVHIHFEEFQTLSINGRAPATSPLVQKGRKDVARLESRDTHVVYFRSVTSTADIRSTATTSCTRPRDDGALGDRRYRR